MRLDAGHLDEEARAETQHELVALYPFAPDIAPPPDDPTPTLLRRIELAYDLPTLRAAWHALAAAAGQGLSAFDRPLWVRRHFPTRPRLLAAMDREILAAKCALWRAAGRSGAFLSLAEPFLASSAPPPPH